MKILTSQQIRAADQYTIQHEPITSIALMERAATQCFAWIKARFALPTSFTLFCGIGNNGGDGLVIARLLHQARYKVKVYVVHYTEQSTDDFRVNVQRLKEVGVTPQAIHEGQALPCIEEACIIIDCLFGTGLRRPVKGTAAKVISAINELSYPVIAIDLPSGLLAEDNRNNTALPIIQATYTLTFEAPKLSFLLVDYASFVGEWHHLAIGLHPDFLKKVETPYFYLTKDMIANLIRPRPKFAHKGHFGHALLVVGSKGKIGAAVLAAKACLRSGAGLLDIHIPACGYEILQHTVPEAMVATDPTEDYLSTLQVLDKYQAIGIGPGIGQQGDTAKLLKALLQNAPRPLVLDADALNLLSKNPPWLSLVPSHSILTPHPKEFERLFGASASDYDRHLQLKEKARQHHVFIVLKGAHTSIACPDGKLYFNSTGNPGMATAGSGDVLTGMITGLLAQGYTPKAACLIGVYLHGRAGDLAAYANGPMALIASDITAHLGKAWLELLN